MQYITDYALLNRIPFPFPSFHLPLLFLLNSLSPEPAFFHSPQLASVSHRFHIVVRRSYFNSAATILRLTPPTPRGMSSTWDRYRCSHRAERCLLLDLLPPQPVPHLELSPRAPHDDEISIKDHLWNRAGAILPQACW